LIFFILISLNFKISKQFFNNIAVTDAIQYLFSIPIHHLYQINYFLHFQINILKIVTKIVLSEINLLGVDK